MRQAQLKLLVAVLSLFALVASSTARAAVPEPGLLALELPGKKHLEAEGVDVASVPDVDGDQLADVFVGLETVATFEDGNHVSARLYSGKSGNLLLEIPAPVPQIEASINTVAGLGDLDGDGRSELVVGTPGWSLTQEDPRGIVRIFSAGGALLKSIQGSQIGARLGEAVAPAGDVDGDNFTDVLAGAPNIDQVYLHRGNIASSFPLILELTGQSPGERFGASLARVGLLGPAIGRLRGDIVVGAPSYSARGGTPGRVYVINVAAPAAPRYVLTGTGDLDHLGTDVDGGLDLDGDRVPDFLGGAMGTPELLVTGTGYVRTYSGATGAALLTIPSAEEGDLFGYSAAFTLCGKAPAVVVGAPQAVNPATLKAAGRVQVFNAVSGTLLTSIQGLEHFDSLGLSVAGFAAQRNPAPAELIAGAPGVHQLPVFGAGAAYVYACSPILRPDIAASPIPLLFPTTSVGGSAVEILTVKNLGTAELDVSSMNFLLGSSPAFTLISKSAFQLAPGGTQDVSIRFGPAQPAILSAKLRIVSNDPDTPVLVVPLSGKGVEPAIALVPGSHDFDEVEVGGAMWTGFTVRNEGNTALQVSSIALAQNASGDFSLGGLPVLPQALAPAGEFSFLVIFSPSAEVPRSAVVRVMSDDPQTPAVEASVQGEGVAPSFPPVAVIHMDVPYTESGRRVQFRGTPSFDPDGVIQSRLWDFGHAGIVSVVADPIHTFPAPAAAGLPRHFVVRLTATDNEGRKDTTSITALTHHRTLRSRFYGKALFGSMNVAEGTVVEAWVRGEKAAESLVQIHLGRSVYAIEVPAQASDVQGGHGGFDGDVVTFRYKGKAAPETGVWYQATDQELNLKHPFSVPPKIQQPEGSDSWCLLLPGDIYMCGDLDDVPPDGLDFDLVSPLPPPPPPPPPGSFRMVKGPFELEARLGGTPRELAALPGPVELQIGYNPAELESAGVEDPSTLALYRLEGAEWKLVGWPEVDLSLRSVKTTITRPGVYALLGAGKGDPGPESFVRGDANADGTIDLSDGIAIFSFLFLGGAAPVCHDAADTNDEGTLSISSGIFVLNYLFTGGRPPPAPHPSCGLDPTADALGRCAYPREACGR